MEKKKLALYCLLMLCIVATACQRKPEPIRLGVDQCHACKMLITDNRFGAEVISPKGRIYKFDDLICMKAYLADGEKSNDPDKIYLVEYNTHALMDMSEAKLYFSEYLRSPMNGNVAAFNSEVSREKFSDNMEGKPLTLDYILD